MMRYATARLLALVSLLSLSGCMGTPDGVQPVSDFELDRYLGTWYEIARLDHSFERGLSRVTAEYSLRDDGGVRVVNRGYDASSGKWKESVGKAYFVEDESLGYLKVSFFGPFYGSYVVFELDHAQYGHAFVSGHSTSYLWLLSRTPAADKEVVDRFLERAEALGFDTGELIFVDQE